MILCKVTRWLCADCGQAAWSNPKHKRAAHETLDEYDSDDAREEIGLDDDEELRCDECRRVIEVEREVEYD